MNNFTARKLGEVLAFAETGLDTLQRTEVIHKNVISVQEFNTLISTCKQHAEFVREIARKNNLIDVVEAKAQATNHKIRGMRDAYIGNEWEDITEVDEWQGFYIGAAIAHWSLIEGAAETGKNMTLRKFAVKAKKFYSAWQNNIANYLKLSGASRARE